MVQYVYLDVVFLVNWLMNWLILWAVARLSDSPSGALRLCLASMCGAAYSVVVCLNPSGWLVAPVSKVLVLFVMVIVSFKPTTVAYGLRQAAFFLTLCFSVAGASMATGHFLGLSVESPSSIVVLGGAALAAGGLHVLAERYKKKGALPSTVTARVTVGHHTSDLRAFVDTGNHLHDPLSGLPVIVAEQNALLPLMPEDVREALSRQSGDDLQDLSLMSGTSWASRFRVLPFESIGKKGGMLMGFRPDAVTLMVTGSPPLEKRAIVGVFTRSMSSDGAYNALVGPGLVANNTK